MAYHERNGKGILTLGDQPGQITEIEGELVAIRPSTTYLDNKVYDVRTLAGEQVTIGGTAGLNARLGERDVGAKVLIRFKGTGRTKQGATFKETQVFIDDGQAEDTSDVPF